MTTGFDAELPKGLVVIALQDAHDDWETYPGLPAIPEDYGRWERILVPEADLALKDEYRGYDGFHLSFTVQDIGSRLTPLPRKATADGPT
jgi:hypothetical protein